MAERAYTNVGIWFDGYDLSGYLRGVGLTVNTEMLDKTTFADLTRIMHPGLQVVNTQVEGIWDSSGEGIPEKPIFTNIGVTDKPWSFAPENTEGGVAYTFKAANAEYTPGGSVGDMLTFTASAEASGSKLVRGALLFDKSGLAASGNGTKFQVGAVAAGQTMYAALHVMAAGTGTFDGVLQSDADSSAGGETGRITFTQATGITSEWQTVAGPITDTWWRLNYTIAGAAPSSTVALIIGIL